MMLVFREDQLRRGVCAREIKGPFDLPARHLAGKPPPSPALLWRLHSKPDPCFHLCDLGPEPAGRGVHVQIRLRIRGPGRAVPTPKPLNLPWPVMGPLGTASQAAGP